MRKRKKYIRRRIAALTVIAVLAAVVVVVLTLSDRPKSQDKEPTVHERIVQNTPKPKLFYTAQASSAIAYSKNLDCAFYAKNEDDRLFPASTTKLLTALTALDYASQDDLFTVGNELWLLGYNSSVAGLEKGDELTLFECLEAMLIPSGNDAAYVIAANIGRAQGGEELTAREAVKLFMGLMNEKALSLGAKNTHFTCPDGYHDDEHTTTAEDMLLIARAAYANESIRLCVEKTSETLTTKNGHTLTLKSTNSLMNPKSSHYRAEVTGMKTGYTGYAKNCVVASAEKDGRTVFVLIFGEESSDMRWTDCGILTDAALKAATDYEKIKAAEGK